MAVPNQEDLSENEEYQIGSIQQAKSKEISFSTSDKTKTDTC